MISRKKIASYPAENRYKSADFETSKIVSTIPSLMLDLYAFNKTNAIVYLVVVDNDNSDFTDSNLSGQTYTTYPIPALGYVSLANDKGERFANGIVVATYSDALCTSIVANACKFNIGWNNYV